MKTESETQRLARLVGGTVHPAGVLLSLAQARLLAGELDVLEALVDRKVLSPEYELLGPSGPETLLAPGRAGL